MNELVITCNNARALYREYTLRRISNDVNSLKPNWKKYIENIKTARGKDLVYLVDFMHGIDSFICLYCFDDNEKQWFLDLRSYINYFIAVDQFVDFIGNYDFTEHLYNDQKSEMEHLMKAYLDLPLDLPLYKGLVEKIKQQPEWYDVIMKPVHLHADEWLECSVLFLKFLQEFIKVFPDDRKRIAGFYTAYENLEKFPEYSVNIDEYIHFILNVDSEKTYDYNVTFLELYLEERADIAIKSVVYQLYKTCKLDDNADITISKSTILDLFNIPDMKKYLRANSV